MSTDTITWQAVYNDDTSLWECDPSGNTINKYEDIDRKRLCVFNLYSTTQVRAGKVIPERFKIVDSVLSRLKWDGVTDDVLTNLQKLQNQEYVGPEKFSSVLNEIIGVVGDNIIKLIMRYSQILTPPLISVEIRPGYRLIWRKRRHQRVIGNQKPFKTVYLVGWQTTIQSAGISRNVQSILYIQPTGTVEMSGSRTDFELLSFEKDLVEEVSL